MKTLPDKKSIFLLFLTAVLLTSSYGWSNVQSDNTDSGDKSISIGERITSMATLMNDYYPEKIYIQTDRPIYNLYDTIWFKVWVMQAGTLYPTEKSRIVYIDLINEENLITQSTQYSLVAGSANGQFILTKAIQDEGLYRIRAYTRWQKNFGDSASFEKIIPIWGDKDKDQEIDKKPFVLVYNKSGRPIFVTQKRYQKMKQKEEEEKSLLEQQKAERDFELDVQFLPEGGRLIAGVPNRVAFKALFRNGMSVPVEGTILDSEGKEITSFASVHKGMGSFLLVPESAKQYTALLFNGDKINLPVVEQEGLGLMVVSEPLSDTLSVAVNATTDIVNKLLQFTLLIESRGIMKEAYKIQMNRSRLIIRIPKEGLETGINRITLFSDDGEPLCERLVYIHKEDHLQFDIKANWEIKSDTSQKMTLKIRPQMNGIDVQSAFAMSVTNKNLVQIDSSRSTFLSEMFLSSELKGFIEEPGYYFNNPYDSVCKQMDLLMLTQGWRGYDWDHAFRKEFNYPPDTNFCVSGTVLNLVNKPIAGRRVTLFVQGGKTTIDECRTDNSGRFSFTNLDVREESMARVKIEKEKKKNRLGLWIKFDSLVGKPYFPIVSISDFLYEVNKTDSLLFRYKNRLDENKAELDSLRKRYGIQLLGEVVVTERKIIKTSYNRSKRGVGDYILDSLNFSRYDAYTNVLDILKAEIPGFKKDLGKARDANGHLIQRSYDYYNIDGKPVYFQVDAEILNGDRSLTSATNAANDAISNETSDNGGSSSGVIINAEDTEYGKMNLIDDALESIAGCEVRAIEVLTTKDNLFNYGGSVNVLDVAFQPIGAVVVITTKKSKGPRGRADRGIYFTKLQGGSTPKNFYVPKYYPKDPIDQINYDGKQVYYWNPTLLTNGEREVEVTFPVSAYMKGNLQLEIEGTDLNGHIGTFRQDIHIKQ